MSQISTYRGVFVAFVFSLISGAVISQNNKVSVNPYTQIIQIGERSTPDWEAVNLEIVSNIGSENATVSRIFK